MAIHQTINTRVALLREWMEKNNITHFIIPSTDPHNSEYTPEHWKVREWITGFNGSAGTAVISMEDAALWTDSRYFIAAEEQLKGTPFVLMKDGLKSTPSIMEWIQEKQLDCITLIGFVGEMVAQTTLESWKSEVIETVSDVSFYPFKDFFDKLWKDRPPLSSAPVRLHRDAFCGLSVKEKINLLREACFPQILENVSVNMYNDLDDIAWLLNLRGTDVEFNTTFVSYFLMVENIPYLCIDKDKLPKDVKAYLRSQDVNVVGYNDWKKLILKCRYPRFVLLADTMNSHVAETLYDENIAYRTSPSELTALRSVKTDDELDGFAQAMERDGVAMVKFRRWLDENVASGTFTECSVSDKLESLRREQPGFVNLSFGTIAAYADHGAIVHYEPTPETDRALKPEGFLLLDSGAHYEEATTDITRTIPLGALTDKMRHIYTLVLKGHINLSRCRFPAGTTGVQLDLAARYGMWQEGYDYGHGTGHAVGACLSVHEHTIQFRKNITATTERGLLPGMVITNEPGIYLPGEFGVRIENVMKTYALSNGFLAFEALTLCPIDTAPIELDLLTAEERAWLNDYHAEVRNRLMPLLDDEADKVWLKNATAAI